MKKNILYGILASVITIAIVLVFYYRDSNPPDIDKVTTPNTRKYSQQDRKEILLSLIEKNPELWQKRYILGGIYIQEGDFDQAANQFREIIKIQPRMIKAHNALGMCYFNMGRNYEAVEAWKNALEIDPTNARASDLIARVRGVEARENQKRKLEILVKKEPSQPRAWFNLGEIYLKEKLYDKAIAALEKASKLDHNNSEYLYTLGLAYHRTQQYDKAETSLKTARLINPGDDRIERLLTDTQFKIKHKG